MWKVSINYSSRAKLDPTEHSNFVTSYDIFIAMNVSLSLVETQNVGIKYVEILTKLFPQCITIIITHDAYIKETRGHNEVNLVVDQKKCKRNHSSMVGI